MNKYFTLCLRPSLFLIFLHILVVSNGQTPPYAKNGGNSGNSTFAWGGGSSSKRVQLLYIPGDFAPAVVPGNITKLYFMYGSSGNTANTVYTNLVINIGQTTNTGFSPSTTFYTGLTNVLTAATYTVNSGTSGTWFEVPLNTPFAYDNTKTLIVEIYFDSYTNSANSTGLGTYSGTSTSGRKLYSATTSASTGSTNTSLQNMGLEIVQSACTTPPTPGNATASAAGCSASAVTLDLTGHTTGTGQTYTWQSSASLAGTYTSFSSASSSPSLVVNPTTTTYYRAAVTCGGNTQYSVPVQALVYQPMSGNYTINKTIPASSTNFQSFSTAIVSLSCAGLAGPVTFDVNADTYNEQVILPSITGSSAVNTVTFNGNGSTVSFSASATGQRATVKLDGTDYVKFDNFIINANAGTYGYGVQLLNDADNNTISNCTINSHINSTSSQFSGIVINTLGSDGAETAGDSKCDGNIISGNTVNGGYVGIALTGNGNTNQINGNQVINNHVMNFYTHGIYVSGNNGAVIKGNDIERPTRSTNLTVFYGIYFENPSRNCLVSENKIHASFDGLTTSTSSQVVINFVNADAVLGSENKVYNNIIYRINGSGIAYGIQNNSSDYVKFYHNSIAIENETPNTGSSPTRGFYFTAAATGVEFVNNIIKISREPASAATGNRIGIDIVTGTDLVSNKNDIIVTSSTLGYFGSYGGVLKNDITAWKSSTGLDVASKSVDPQFINSGGGDLKPQENVLNDIGAAVGITTDILGVTRNTTNPDPGAYEFDAGPCVSPVVPGNSVVTTTATPMCSGYTATLDLENNSVGFGQTYKWQSSATQNGTYSDISPATSGSSLAINPTTSLWYRAEVSCGASTLYSTPVQVVINTPFAGGTYTINGSQPTGGTNFQNFNDAIYAISCGVSSSTIFNVATGIYNEQVIMPAIPGLSASKTITFNGNGAILEFTSTNTSERATLKLNGTDYVTIDNLEIGANGSGNTEYGYAVQLMNDADNNTITNCIIRATTTPATAASSSFAGIVLSGSATSATAASGCDNNSITGNSITGGYYGITVIGSSSAYVQNNSITNNQISDFYTYGIYVGGTNNCLVEKNELTRLHRTSISNYNGIYFNGNSTNAKVSKNKLHDPFVTTTGTINAYGISFVSCDASVGNENVISNNLIYDFKNGGGPEIGLYNSGSDYTKFYHNTISLDDVSSPTATTQFATWGFYQTTTAQGIEFKNNIITITRSGNYTKYALLLSDATSAIISDKNVFYVNSADGEVGIATLGTAEYATLATWKTVGTYDQNSKETNPLYTSASTGDFTPSEPTINNIGANVGVATDIIDVARLVASPDPGAFEFATAGCTTPPTPGTASVNPVTPVCGGEPVILNLTGHDYNAGITYQWESSSTLAGTYSPASSLLNNPEFHLSAAGTSLYYRAAVTCNGVTAYSNSVQVVIPALFSGSYTIDKTAPTSGTNFASFADALNAIRCGIGGPVVFTVVVGSGPYTEQIIIPQVVGMSASNTLTIDGNGESLNFASTNTNERGVIKLNGADYVTIKNFVINSTGTSTSQYAYGVQLLNDADNNIVDRCVINLNITSTSSNYGGIMINSSGSGTVTTVGDSKCDNNIISNNSITGGNFGIAIVANSKTGQVNNNMVIGNTVTDFYTHGIYLNGGVNTLIEGNEISRMTRSSSITTCYSINLVDSSLATKISKNRIHDPFAGNISSTSGAYGIRLSNGHAEVTNETLITNNLIYNFANAGTQNGILIDNGNYVKIYHNTISLDDASSTCTTCGTRSIYVQASSTVGLDIRNNIFTIGRAGTGDKQFMFFAPTSVSSFAIDRNVYYYSAFITGVNEIARVGGTGSSGTGGTSYVTLSDWNTATGKDANSAFVDPEYTDPANGNFKPTRLSIDNIGTPLGITTDIINVNRSALAPDAGAYEFGTTLPVTLTNFRGQKIGEVNKLSWSTSTEVNNKGFELQRSADGKNFTALTFVGSKAADGNSNAKLDYSFTDEKPLRGNNYYRLKQVDKDGKFTYSDIVLLKSSIKEITISSVYPNPATEKLNLVITSPSAEKLQIVVTDLSGKLILQQSTSVVIGDTQVQFNIASLASGTYVVKAICANGCEPAVHRFVKQ